jgi:hypothetical protein
VAAALSAGWKLAKPAKYAGPTTTTKLIAVCVETSGGDTGRAKIKYAWKMDRNDFTSFGATLGIQEVTANDEVVYGCASPKPTSVYKVIAGSTGTVKTTGSFCSDLVLDTAKADGWKVRKLAVPYRT